MNIYPASQNNFSKAIGLLKKNNLPTEDVTSGTQLFVIEDGNEVIGTIAVEYDYNDALLRSLCVSEQKRNLGLGIELVNFIEDYVQKQGVQNIYLLTTTAANFFSKRGYDIIDRNAASGFIKQTSEYCTVCPSTATVMKKLLA
jgi:amino-acid N-acetyltransferase